MSNRSTPFKQLANLLATQARMRVINTENPSTPSNSFLSRSVAKYTSPGVDHFLESTPESIDLTNLVFLSSSISLLCCFLESVLYAFSIRSMSSL